MDVVQCTPRRRRAGRGLLLVAALVSACVTARGGRRDAPAAAPTLPPAAPAQPAAGPAPELGALPAPVKSGAAPDPTAPVMVEDSVHGVRYLLPPIEGGWRMEAGGQWSRLVKVEVGTFPMSRPGTPLSCRETAQARLAAIQQRLEEESAARDGARPSAAADGLRDEKLTDLPTAGWSFTRGAQDVTAVRSRWGFFARGADCLMLQVVAPLGEAAGDRVYAAAGSSLQVSPLPAERQREIDLSAGMSFLERHDPAAALERFEALAGREPALSRAHFGVLMAAFELGPPSYGRAISHGEAVLKAERELSAEQRQLALRALGVMQLTENQVRSAAETLAELVVRAPELAEGQYNYACALARLGDSSGALEHLGTAFTLDPSLRLHAGQDNDLGSLHGNQGFEKLLQEPAAR